MMASDGGCGTDKGCVGGWWCLWIVASGVDN